jgi:hypothetical protein
MAIGMGESKEKVRAMMIEVHSLKWNLLDHRLIVPQKMIQPVGKPPEVQD